MSKYKLRPYMVHAGEPIECAYLIFAKTAREAKKMADGLDGFDEYIYIRAEWIKNDEYIYTQANQQMLNKGESHIADPESCSKCYQWGDPPYNDGICNNCNEIEKEVKS